VNFRGQAFEIVKIENPTKKDFLVGTRVSYYERPHLRSNLREWYFLEGARTTFSKNDRRISG
jgi:hypothetical protein